MSSFKTLILYPPTAQRCIPLQTNKDLVKEQSDLVKQAENYKEVGDIVNSIQRCDIYKNFSLVIHQLFLLSISILGLFSSFNFITHQNAIMISLSSLCLTFQVLAVVIDRRKQFLIQNLNAYINNK